MVVQSMLPDCGENNEIKKVGAVSCGSTVKASDAGKRYLRRSRVEATASKFLNP